MGSQTLVHVRDALTSQGLFILFIFYSFIFFLRAL